MDHQDQEERNEFSMLLCIRTAMHMTGRHARSLFDRVSRLFSRLNCMKVNVEDGGRHYSRRLTAREKVFVVREVEKTFKEQASQTSSYDSLADETLFFRCSAHTSPAMSICHSTESGTTTDSSSIYDYEYTPKAFSYRGSCSPPTCFPMFTTPVRPFSIDSLERLPEPEISKSLPAVLNPENSDVSSVLSSPVSYYRSGDDLDIEDVDSSDDGFWDTVPPKY